MFLWPEIASGTIRLGYVQAWPVRTRYVEAGDPSADEAVVFIPGTGGHLEAFTRNLLPHAAHFRTIALDMVGHGYSDKPDHDYEIRHYVQHLLDFCDALGLARIHVHGESLGGWIAAQFAIDHPERTASLTLNTAGGLANVRDHLTTGGTFALWSDDPASEDFTEHLRQIFGASAAHNVEFPNPYSGLTSVNSVYVAQKIGG